MGSWRIPLAACPELETPAAPVRPRLSGRPGTAFHSNNSVGVRNDNDFGAESSRPATLLCTLRTHQSPGEWQHSLPACWLALAGRDSHPLDSSKRFHLLISAPPLPSFSQRDIRLFQPATICSVGVCRRVCRFPRICTSSVANSPPRRRANSIWRAAVGRTVLPALGAVTDVLTWSRLDVGSARSAAIRYR